MKLLATHWLTSIAAFVFVAACNSTKGADAGMHKNQGDLRMQTIPQPPLGGHWNWDPPPPAKPDPKAQPAYLIISKLMSADGNEYTLRIAQCWGGTGDRPTKYAELKDMGRPLPGANTPLKITVVNGKPCWILAYLAGFDSQGRGWSQWYEYDLPVPMGNYSGDDQSNDLQKYPPLQ